MGYVVLWISDLAVAFLLVATVLACTARWRRPWLRCLLPIAVAFLPFAAYAGLAVAAGYYKFHSHMPGTQFEACVAASIVHALAAWCLLRRGFRQEEGRPIAAAWPRGRLAVALLVAFSVSAMTFWNLDLAVRQQLIILRAEAGTLALSVAPPRIPDRDNAALVYCRAFEMMSDNEFSSGPEGREWPEDWPTWVKWLEPDNTDFDPADRELRAYLKRQAPAMALLRAANEKSGCRFDRDFGRPTYWMPKPELAPMQEAARLLALDARCRAADGDVRGALEDANIMFTVAEFSGNEPTLVSMVVAAVVDRLALETLQAVLAYGPATTEDLAVVRISPDVSYRRLLARGLRVEEAMGQSVFSMMDSPEQLAVLDDDLWWMEAAAPLYRVFLLRDDLQTYRWAMNGFSELASRPYHEAKPALGEFVAEMRVRPRGPLTSMLVPRTSKLPLVVCDEAAAAADARRRLARVGLAWHQYRAAEGRAPETLEDLVPRVLRAIPRDPFDGRPLKLKPTKDGRVVYSIGPDGVDNGGIPGDITFTLPK